jgi:hypothetical protein
MAPVALMLAMVARIDSRLREAVETSVRSPSPMRTLGLLEAAAVEIAATRSGVRRVSAPRTSSMLNRR